MRATSHTQVVNGEGVLRRGLIPEPPKQAGQRLWQLNVSVPSPASSYTVLLQALCQEHLPAAQCTTPASVCGQLRRSCAHAMGLVQSSV